MLCALWAVPASIRQQDDGASEKGEDEGMRQAELISLAQGGPGKSWEVCCSSAVDAALGGKWGLALLGKPARKEYWEWLEQRKQQPTKERQASSLAG
jgi:hypothetical protein